MGAKAASGSRRLPEPEINVTPLVDVVLVLLIIFMVVTPELEHGARVDLPAVYQPDEKAKSHLDPITVTITSNERLFLEKEPVADLKSLGERLSKIKQDEPDRRVIIKGDSSLRYVRMREAFALCQKIGFAGISLSVSQRGKGNKTQEEG
jgi:biopolymer transport protein TolR